MTDNQVTLTLIHSNDLHSHFEETSRIASYIAEVRAKQDEDKLVLLDCGDFMDRVRLETEGTQGFVNRDIMEFIGYDAVALGNNEGLSYTTNELDKLFHQMSMPVVCANMMLSETGQCPSWMVPTLTIVKSGFRIGLIGLTAPYHDYYKLLGWNSLDPMEVLHDEINRLRPEVDVLIVLSHLGLRHDERMATEIEGIDLILGGHTHHLLEAPLLVEKTVIGAAGKFGYYIGHLELVLDKETKKLLHITGGSLPTKDLPTHAGLDALIAQHHEKARQVMSRQVANLQEPIEWLPYEESPLSTLLAAAVLRKTATDISMINAGQLLQGLDPGVVTAEMIHAICPSPINLCSMMLTGRQIVRVIEESLLPEFYELEIRGFGFRGVVLGTLCMDGIELIIDPSKAPYERVVEARIKGTSVEPNREYSVGTLDMFTFGVGYTGLKEGKDVRYFLPEFLRDVLSEALNEERWVEDCKKPRTYLITS